MTLMSIWFTIAENVVISLCDDCLLLIFIGAILTCLAPLVKMNVAVGICILHNQPFWFHHCAKLWYHGPSSKVFTLYAYCRPYI